METTLRAPTKLRGGGRGNLCSFETHTQDPSSLNFKLTQIPIRCPERIKCKLKTINGHPRTHLEATPKAYSDSLSRWNREIFG